MIKGLLDAIASHGNRGAVVPFPRIEDLKKDMLEVQASGYHTDWLDRMVNHMTGDTAKFAPAEFQPRSLISVVMPSSKVILRFQYRGKPVQCVVPPLYTTWDSKNNQTLQAICDYLSPHGYTAAMIKTVTQKLLAVHCGLAQYGRNNICYHEEFGSYMQIMTYVSDMPCEEHTWHPIKRMDICDDCRACIDACPTVAIDAERRYIDADRCITTYNEPPSGDFPAWLGKDVHNSIVGCTRCQDCCPANAQNAGNTEVGLAFTENETQEILNANMSYYNPIKQ